MDVRITRSNQYDRPWVYSWCMLLGPPPRTGAGVACSVRSSGFRLSLNVLEPAPDFCTGPQGIHRQSAFTMGEARTTPSTRSRSCTNRPCTSSPYASLSLLRDTALILLCSTPISTTQSSPLTPRVSSSTGSRTSLGSRPQRRGFGPSSLRRTSTSSKNRGRPRRASRSRRIRRTSSR